ncbi:hypothetical protein BVI2075_50070 [Burkholderia vietnamiensis]|nr:hypothetical protein BVI2075_50070 [Burkholderia vietnamiensis]
MADCSPAATSDFANVPFIGIRVIPRIHSIEYALSDGAEDESPDRIEPVPPVRRVAARRADAADGRARFQSRPGRPDRRGARCPGCRVALACADLLPRMRSARLNAASANE